MAKSDQLFLLVKSLTSQEKRYFKIDAAKHQSNGSKNYLRLFDAMDAQKFYDEKIIRKKLSNDPYFRRLADVKLYLHRQIMRSMLNFHHDSSQDIVLNNLLTEIEFLFKKGLFKNCLNTIRKAKLYALKHEKLPQLLKLTDWEIKVADHSNALHDIEPLKQAIIGAKEAADKHKDIIELKRIYLESKAIFFQKGNKRNAEEIAKIDRILQHPLMQKEVNTFEGESFRLTVKVHYAQFKRDFMATYSETARITRLYELHPDKSGEYFNIYFHGLAVLANDSMAAQKYKITEGILQQMKNTYAKKSGKLTLMNKIRLLHVEADFLLHQGEHNKALDIIPKINELVEASYEELNIIEKLFLDSLYFNVYFKSSDFKNAQYYIQRIINYNADVRMDIQSSVRIANLILQYEQHEFEYLGYVLRSTYRYLTKKQRRSEPEKIILGFLRRALRFSSEKEVRKGLLELKLQISIFINDPFVTDVCLMEWIDSKLQKKDLAEIYKERYLVAIANEEACNAMKMTG